MSRAISLSALPYSVEYTLTLPGSKSHANRAIVCACLSEGTTVIHGATPCDDVEVMVTNLRKMGFQIEWVDKEKGELKIGPHPRPLPPAPQGGAAGEGERRRGQILDCHNAGTTLRFLTSLCAVTPGEWILTGDMNMQKRPIGDLVEALQRLGAEISDTNGCPPLTIRGKKLEGGSVRLKANVSSQYLSSLLLLSPMFNKGLKIELQGELASEAYVGLTKKTMRDFGIFVQSEYPAAETSRLGPRPEVAAAGYSIEGDWSAAGAWLVLNALTKSSVTFSNLKDDSEQADRALPTFIKQMKQPGDLTLDCSSVPDQVMNLAVLAAYRKGKTKFVNIANLRKKECDRLSVLTSELTKAGVQIQEQPNGIVILGEPKTKNQPFEALTGPQARKGKPVTLDPHDDHRMAMAFTILGLVRGNVTILSPRCVAKSYPNFFDDVKIIEKSNRPIVIVGMRGAGKSSLCKKLASKLKLKAVDSDKELEKEIGPLRAFVEKHGWPEFRKKEEQTIARVLRPGIVLACGGGATETPAVRSHLKMNATVVWLKAHEAALVKRLKTEKRPRLTSLPLHEEVKKLVSERTPHYKEVAMIEVSANLHWNKQVPYIMEQLRKFILPVAESRDSPLRK